MNNDKNEELEYEWAEIMIKEEYDEDKVGRMSEEEILQMVLENLEKINPKEALDMMKRVDWSKLTLH